MVTTKILFYIQNRGFCGNCLSWWRPDGNGYTCDLRDAWKVPYEEAKRICRMRQGMDVMWPASVVESHVVYHVTESLLRDHAAKVTVLSETGGER
jgi:hypothetical protein